MVIRKLLVPRIYPDRLVIEAMDGTYQAFSITPARQVQKEDLIPLPYFLARGRNGEEAPDYMYWMYGLTKAKAVGAAE